MSLFDQISKEIVSAMKAKDRVRLDALRNIKKLFLEAKTAPGANDELSDENALKILQKLAKQGKESATLYQSQNRSDLAEVELQQVAVIESFLPRPLTPEEIELQVKEIVVEVGAHSPSDLGKVMGIASKKLAGKAEGRIIAEIAKKLLTPR